MRTQNPSYWVMHRCLYASILSKDKMPKDCVMPAAISPSFASAYWLTNDVEYLKNIPRKGSKAFGVIAGSYNGCNRICNVSRMPGYLVIVWENDWARENYIVITWFISQRQFTSWIDRSYVPFRTARNEVLNLPPDVPKYTKTMLNIILSLSSGLEAPSCKWFLRQASQSSL